MLIDARTTVPVSIRLKQPVLDIQPETDLGALLDEGYALGCAEVEKRIKGMPGYAPRRSMSGVLRT
jgi:hypothetical protein